MSAMESKYEPHKPWQIVFLVDILMKYVMRIYSTNLTDWLIDCRAFVQPEIRGKRSGTSIEKVRKAGKTRESQS